MSHCVVVVPILSLIIAKVVPALNVSLHGRFFVVMNDLCLVLLNPLPVSIRNSNAESRVLALQPPSIALLLFANPFAIRRVHGSNDHQEG